MDDLIKEITIATRKELYETDQSLFEEFKDYFSLPSELFGDVIFFEDQAVLDREKRMNQFKEMLFSVYEIKKAELTNGL